MCIVLYSESLKMAAFSYPLRLIIFIIIQVHGAAYSGGTSPSKRVWEERRY